MYRRMPQTVNNAFLDKEFAHFEIISNFAPDEESQKRLVAHHRVFFLAIHSRMRRLERSLIRNLQNPKSHKLPLSKEILRFPAKLRKNLNLLAVCSLSCTFAAKILPFRQ